MLTLEKSKEAKEICKIVGGRKQSLYYYPIEDIRYMNSVEDLHAFNTQDFRDNFEITKTQATQIFDILNGDDANVEIPNSLHTKYFAIKRFIKNSLMTSMDLSDTKQSFRIDFEDNLNFTGHMILASSTQAGKTHFIVQQLLRALKKPREIRRNIIYLSSEWHKDKTVQPLKDPKYHEYVEGIGISDNDIPETGTKLQYFEEIRGKLLGAKRGTIVVADDSMDSFAPHEFRHLFDKMLRTSRHDSVSLCLIFHSIKSGVFTSQGMNSVRYLVIFPRSQKMKVQSFINKDLGIPIRETRRLLRKISQTGRSLILRMHSPECIIGEKFLQLL